MKTTFASPAIRPRRAPRSFSWARLAIVLAILIPFSFPLVYLMSLSLKSREQYIADPNSLIPHPLDFSNFTRAWERGHLGAAMLNSFTAVIVGVVVLVVTAVPAAYWFHQHSGRVSQGIRVSLFAAMSFPLIAMVIPLFVILNTLKLIDNLAMLGVIYGVINLPFGIYLMTGFLKTGLPDSVLEAAQVDGASMWKVFTRMVIPLSMPAITTLAALAFVWTWGDLLLAVVLLQDSANQTIMIAVSNLNGLRDSLDVRLNAAAALIAMSPIVPIFLLSQRALARGFQANVDK